MSTVNMSVKEKNNIKKFKSIPPWVEWSGIILVALVIAFILRLWVVQPFYIPSESMVPTLNVGDRILVNKMSYKIHSIQRGDIVVFVAPKEVTAGATEDYIKRVIGLPGDTVEGKCVNGDDICSSDVAIYVNGLKLAEPYLPKNTQSKVFEKQTIPAGHIWVLGDNRLNSQDSTDPRVGPIDIDVIIGRAFMRILPINDVRFF